MKIRINTLNKVTQMVLKKEKSLWFVLIIFLFSIDYLIAQSTILETKESIKTYPYSDPNMIAAMGINHNAARYYPYYIFDGYASHGEYRDWKIVELENPYIKVKVLPEVGGKVMGAIEKSTGEEFVYLNHVMKFRAIGVRGPWTSGGIEHNFGLDLGHAPWTAAPVDYLMKNNEDGSVSCFVGGIDLASRSQWRVEIRLPKDKAYFETRSLWYNPTPLHHAYLSWENAAYKATNDLQFFFPGTHHINHNGGVAPWPIDNEGRDLSFYKNNNFGTAKSYHVMGTFTNWYGGYWHDKSFGFGHWAPYEDAPGKKLWIWPLSRSGGIWEDLLTDNDGQYIEAQSGVKFNQAGELGGYHSPFNQLSLAPFYTETKTDYWFPVKATGGMVDATPYGTLNVIHKNNDLTISVSPISEISDSLKVFVNKKEIYRELLTLLPMQNYSKTISLPLKLKYSDDLSVTIGNNRLSYSNTNKSIIDRPLKSTDEKALGSAERLFRLGEEENAMRDFESAMHFYMECISKESTHSDALSRIAELYYRKGDYAEGVKYVKRVLENNTYDGGANYMYGVLENSLGNKERALEAFSVSTRTMEYRSGAYAQMASIKMQLGDYQGAASCAKKSIEYNHYNLMAYELLASCYRKLKNNEAAKKILDELVQIDPLSHYANFENYSLDPTVDNLQKFNAAIRNEFPAETYLELALQYVRSGLEQDAIKVLEQAPKYPTVYYWLAYLNRDVSATKSKEYLNEAIKLSPFLVFPFRIETIPVLQWAQLQQASWKNDYYLGLLYWGILDIEKAKQLFNACGEKPDYAPFYIARSLLMQKNSTPDRALSDLKKANSISPNEWRTWHMLNAYYRGNDLFEKAVEDAKKAYHIFPENPIIAMDYAKSLLQIESYDQSLKVLDKIHFLPQEGASEGHDIFVLAHLLNAIKKVKKKKYSAALNDLVSARLWPENLGTGEPYDPDYRLQDYISVYAESKLGNKSHVEQLVQDIIEYSLIPENWNQGNQLNNYISLTMLKKSGRKMEADTLIADWLTEQDSIRKWNLGKGSSASEVQWVLAKYKGLEKEANDLKLKILTNDNSGLSTVFFEAIRILEKEED
ncbi:DUF5107 domain-containing protein [Mariniflexile sp. HMF6888]|uniref:DUF5107 domain-containing protein n=1 Tax=Mariniflexile sp. HMF6888 TaxID=3373086 RepID=UPI0037A84C14